MRRLAILLMIGFVCLGLGDMRPTGAEDDAALLAPPPPPPPPLPLESPTAPGGDTTSDDAVLPIDDPAAIPLPDDVPAVPAEVSSPDSFDTEFEVAGDAVAGYITGGRVNIRAGRSTRYEIIDTVDEGTQVSVYAKVEDWTKIGYPANQTCWIHQEYVEGDIPAEIPAEGLMRVVSGDNVRLRVRPWEKSTVVGKVQKGDLITVVGLRGEWLKIKPPANTFAWVFGKYVRTDGTVTEEAPDPDEPKPGITGNAKEIKKTVAEAKKAELEKQIQEKMRLQHEAAMKRAAAKAEEQRRRLDTIIQSVEDEMSAIAEETQKAQDALDQQMVQVSSTPTQDVMPGGGFTGWVEYIGRVGQRPAAYRLNKGGEVLFLLRSVQYDLSNYINRRVVLDGTVELAPGWEANVLVVENIRMLDEGPATVRDMELPSRIERTPIIIETIEEVPAR